MSVKDFLSQQERDTIVNAIKKAETKSSGEIRIRIESKLKEQQSIDRAKDIFHEMGMHKTLHQNGVLIYVAVEDKQFAIIGDTKIDAIVNQEYWHKLSVTLKEYFLRGKYGEGIVVVIDRIGDILHQYFSIKEGEENINELPNDISFED